MRFRAALSVVIGLAFAQLSFGDMSAASNGSKSSCVNSAGSPTTDVWGTLHAAFDCTLYNDAPTYTIDLTPVMMQGGANLLDNVVGAGYEVVIKGDPLALADDSTGLFNQSLWSSVLFWQGDQDAGYASDSLTVYTQGSVFPPAALVEYYDQNLYAGFFPDSAFFVQATGTATLYAPGSNTYDVVTPEPGLMRLLLGVGLVLLAGAILKRRRLTA